MHRGQHPRAHQEGAQHRESEGRQRQEHGPAGQRAALFGDDRRVQQGRGDEPGHEGGVLDRVPEPPAAPAQFVIGPPRAHGDAEGQEDPRPRRPRPRPARPGGIELTGEEGGDGEGVGHRETDVAHVEQRRVDDQAGVLQQRIKVAAFGGCGQQAFEGVGGEQDEEQEAETDQAERAEDAGDHGFRQLARQHGDQEGPPGEHQDPQQQRAFVSAPDAGDAVLDGQQRVGVLGDVDHREIVGDEGLGQAGEGEGDQQRHGRGGRAGEGDPGQAVGVGADQRQRAEEQCDQRGKDEGEMAEFGDHAQ
ncbi:hypothetical protein SDC9_151811 [bioreactor metagenome]|uniref:Uncharacterized protein n=1 Tax=bioreactor metagenome TaxID=1076179 RepID=A0A645ET29_9ZZZZ